jgi:DNA-binding GntR family transcriptional regulator
MSDQPAPSAPISAIPGGRAISAQEAALAVVRQAILRGDLLPGQKILQADIAELAGSSRVPVREALQQLAAEGLIDYESRRGYTVSRPDEKQLREIYLMRQLMENELLRQAWRRIDDELVAVLADLVAAVSVAAERGDLVAFADSQKAFQFAIFDRADLPRMLRMVVTLWHSADVYRALFLRSDGAVERVAAEHVRLLEAVERRDRRAALQELDVMRVFVVDRIVALIADAAQ